MKKNIYFLIPLIMIAIACSQKKEITEESNSKLGEISPTSVTVKIVEEKPFEFLVHTSGKIRPQFEAEVYVKSDGLIKRLLVANGDFVVTGQILAELENEKQRLDFEKAEVTLAEKKIAFEDQYLSFSTVKDTSVRKTILENIRYTSGMMAAELALKQAKFDLEQTRIKSPIDGIISSLQVKEYNSVKAGQPAAIIFNPNILLVECLVTEGDALLLKSNYPADVSIPGMREVIAARIINVDQRVSEVNSLVQVQLRLPANLKLIPGMRVEVTLRVPFQKALLVPKEAVVIKNGKSVVFTEESGLAKWNYVTTGRENGNDIEILNGLTVGKQVIITNNLQLAHDAPVRVN